MFFGAGVGSYDELCAGVNELAAGVGVGDDLAHAVLVESLESVVPLQIFEVRAERAIGAELGGLLFGDPAARSRASMRLGRTGHVSPR